jgi:hypothetical protein
VYEVLQYHKSPRYKDLLPVLGSQSMVMSEGHTWRVQRDAFNPGFSSSFLKTALPGFISCTEHLIQQLEAAADQKEVVQLHHLTVLTTLEVICKASAVTYIQGVHPCTVPSLLQVIYGEDMGLPVWWQMQHFTSDSNAAHN